MAGARTAATATAATAATATAATAATATAATATAATAAGVKTVTAWVPADDVGALVKDIVKVAKPAGVSRVALEFHVRDALSDGSFVPDALLGLRQVCAVGRTLRRLTGRLPAVTVVHASFAYRGLLERAAMYLLMDCRRVSIRARYTAIDPVVRIVFPESAQAFDLCDLGSGIRCLTLTGMPPGLDALAVSADAVVRLEHCRMDPVAAKVAVEATAVSFDDSWLECYKRGKQGQQRGQRDGQRDDGQPTGRHAQAAARAARAAARAATARAARARFKPALEPVLEPVLELPRSSAGPRTAWP